MIREICKAEVFLAQKAEAATADDLKPGFLGKQINHIRLHALTAIEHAQLVHDGIDRDFRRYIFQRHVTGYHTHF